MTLEYEKYQIYFAYKKKSDDLRISVTKMPMIITKDESNNNELIMQLISDTSFNLILDKDDEYKFFIFLVKRDNHFLSYKMRTLVSEYLYKKNDSIFLLKEFKLKENILNDFSVTLYENNLSYNTLVNILIRFIPSELIYIIYNYLNIKTLSLNVYNINNKKYICNPTIYLEKKNIKKYFDRNIELLSSHPGYKYII